MTGKHTGLSLAMNATWVMVRDSPCDQRQTGLKMKHLQALQLPKNVSEVIEKSLNASEEPEATIASTLEVDVLG